MKIHEEGITLIALIVTIVILIILTAITISNVMGNDLFGLAKGAVENYVEAGKKEEDAINELMSYLQDGDNKEEKANAPELTDGMIPVKYDVTKKVWVMCTKDDPEWYSYTKEEKKWANVMLSDGTYKTLKVGQEVAEEDLGSMFVWIPRYAYKITEGYHSNTGKLEVVFLNGVSDEYYDGDGKVQTAKRGPISDEDKEGGVYKNYIVHPAFTDGEDTGYKYGEWKREIRGIWIAKFQAGLPTTSKDVQTKVTYTSHSDYLGEDTTATVYYPIFKGRKFAYNNITVSDCYLLSQKIDDTSNPYGLATSANAHLLKNSEWGAVAYLSISQYGYSDGIGDEAHVKANNDVSLAVNSKPSTSPITNTNLTTPTVANGVRGTSYITAITGYSAEKEISGGNYKSNWGTAQTLDSLLSSENGKRRR